MIHIKKIQFFKTRQTDLSIRKRLLLFVISLIVSTGLINIYSNLNARKVVAKYDAMFQKTIWINSLADDTDESYQAIKQY